MTNFYVTYKLADRHEREAFYGEVKKCGAAEKTRKEDGCIRYDFFFPADSDDEIFLWEQWETREHQAEHCKTAHFAQLGELKKKYGVTADIQIEDR